MELFELKRSLKRSGFSLLARCGLDRLFRHLNRNKLLVVMYHGVTSRTYAPPVWTQLPVEVFTQQLEFLGRHYRIVTLSEVIAAVEGRGTLPERAAIITFDDGIRNNYTVAFPVLSRLGIPASIFLTVDLVGSNEILWFDELYLLIQEAGRRSIPLTCLCASANSRYVAGDFWGAYAACVESVKRVGERTRDSLLTVLRKTVTLQKEEWLEDFGLLNWDQVVAMERSGLMSFGVHTATHRILAELDDQELVTEVLNPRATFAQMTGRDAESFCFPNGRPGVDFLPKHQQFLRKCGYRCAFTTENGLFDWRGDEPMGIRRVPAGNDSTSDPSYFSLNTSGAVTCLRRCIGG